MDSFPDFDLLDSVVDSGAGRQPELRWVVLVVALVAVGLLQLG